MSESKSIPSNWSATPKNVRPVHRMMTPSGETAAAWIIKLLEFVLLCDRDSLSYSSVVRNQVFVVNTVLILASTKTTAQWRSYQQMLRSKRVMGLAFHGIVP